MLTSLSPLARLLDRLGAITALADLRGALVFRSRQWGRAVSADWASIERTAGSAVRDLVDAPEASAPVLERVRTTVSGRFLVRAQWVDAQDPFNDAVVVDVVARRGR
ncbi:MAG: hypothetical protein NW201_09105 [Gemmatimonadales bacterium]|nr:hypothetical protein [Gemmatimonadales bacterium]